MARLAALVPKPRMHLTRYHGEFAPHSQHRAAMTPAQRGRGALRPPASDADPRDSGAEPRTRGRSRHVRGQSQEFAVREAHPRIYLGTPGGDLHDELRDRRQAVPALVAPSWHKSVAKNLMRCFSSAMSLGMAGIKISVLKTRVRRGGQ